MFSGLFYRISSSFSFRLSSIKEKAIQNEKRQSGCNLRLEKERKKGLSEEKHIGHVYNTCYRLNCQIDIVPVIARCYDKHAEPKKPKRWPPRSLIL